MRYFSDKFLNGLKTKSEDFQLNFAECMHNVYSYFDSMIAESDEDDTVVQFLAEMDEYEEYCKVIESAITFAPQENIICPIAMTYVGDIELYKKDEDKTFAEMIMSALNWQLIELPSLDDYDYLTSLRKIKILFIGIRCKEGDFTDDDITALLLYLNFVMRGNHPNIKIKRSYTPDGIDSEWLILGLR